MPPLRRCSRGLAFTLTEILVVAALVVLLLLMLMPKSEPRPRGTGQDHCRRTAPDWDGKGPVRDRPQA